MQVILALSVLSWAATAFIFDALNQDRMKGGMQRIFGSANVWVRSEPPVLLLLLLLLLLRVARCCGSHAFPLLLVPRCT